MSLCESGKRRADSGLKPRAGSRFARPTLALALIALAAATTVTTGCQQKMAEQPYYRPYEQTESFADGRSNRPLEPGVVHRGQYLDADPMGTGLTRDEWVRFWNRDKDAPKIDAPANPAGDRTKAYGAPRYDPRDAAAAKVYISEFPFEMTAADLSRGGERFTAFCAVCHGPLGNGKGKIWERGYLKPTSYHTEKVEANEPDETADIPMGYSRGYWRWDIRIPLRQVPPGYIFEVITKGYGAMPDHAAQISPADRWRIAAYVRTLQMSMHAEFDKLPDDLKKKVEGGKTP
jgi:mono/diheme cytochrome c family protein